MIPEMSSGTTSNLTSSINFLVMENLNKHFLLTSKFTLMTIQPKDMAYDEVQFQG